MPYGLRYVISGILAGGILGFRIVLCCFAHPMVWPSDFSFCVVGSLLTALLISYAIPILSGYNAINSQSLFFCTIFGSLHLLALCFGCFLCGCVVGFVWFCFFVCFVVFTVDCDHFGHFAGPSLVHFCAPSRLGFLQR